MKNNVDVKIMEKQQHRNFHSVLEVTWEKKQIKDERSENKIVFQ